MLFYSPLSVTPHFRPPTISPSFSFSHQANYISVTLETCLLNTLSPPAPPSFFFCSSPFSASTCLLFLFTPVYYWLFIFSLHFTPVIVCQAAATSFGADSSLLFPKRWELNMSHRFPLDYCGFSLQHLSR